MRIAFITNEYPPETAFGGIATYIHSVANLLATKGLQVVVFCPTAGAEVLTEVGSLSVVHVSASDPDNFRHRILQAFRSYTEKQTIDVIESTDYLAPYAEVHTAFPDIPLVVKLHTPTFLALMMSGFVPSTKSRLITFIKSFLRGHFLSAFNFSRYIAESDLEYQAIRKAHFVTSPSVALPKLLRKFNWQIPNKALRVLPNPIEPSTELLSIPPLSSSEPEDDKYITYIGRLEIRKGVLDLAQAISVVSKLSPKLRFRFVGADLLDHKGCSIKQELLRILSTSANSVQFIDHLPRAELPNILSAASVCVFPSIWENFPYVCLEAMMAARPVIATSSGGMKEIIRDRESGMLLPPRRPDLLAKRILEITQSSHMMSMMGNAARHQVMENFSSLVLADQYISFYQMISCNTLSSD